MENRTPNGQALLLHLGVDGIKHKVPAHFMGDMGTFYKHQTVVLIKYLSHKCGINKLGFMARIKFYERISM